MERFVAYVDRQEGHEGRAAVGRGRLGPVGRDAARRSSRAIAQLLEAGVAAGTLRSDVNADDVWRAMGSVWSVDAEDQIRTLLRLLMDGLRHTSG